jgi:hypothetical protein
MRERRIEFRILVVKSVCCHLNDPKRDRDTEVKKIGGGWSGSELCPVADFGITGVEPSSSTTIELVSCIIRYPAPHRWYKFFIVNELVPK